MNAITNQQPDDRPWLTLREAAPLMGSSPTSLRRLIAEETIEYRSEPRKQGTRYYVKIPLGHPIAMPKPVATAKETVTPSPPPAPAQTVPTSGQSASADAFDSTPHAAAADENHPGWAVVSIALEGMIEARRDSLKLHDAVTELTAQNAVLGYRVANLEADRRTLLDLVTRLQAELAAEKRTNRTARTFFRWLLRKRAPWAK